MRALLRRRQEPLLLSLAAACLAVIALAPLGWLVLELMAPDAGAAVERLSPLLASRTWTLLLRSLGLAGAVTLGALVLGSLLGLLLARGDVRGRKAVFVLHGFPLFLPPFLLCLGWFHLFGRRGLLGSPATAEVLFSEAGAVAILILAFTPIATALTALALWGVDASLEEAARVFASPRRVASRILIPAARPATILAGIVIFALSFSELGVPMFLRVDAYPAAIFARLGGVTHAPGEAFALVLPLLPVALALLIADRALAGRRSFAVLRLRGFSHPPIALGRWRGAASVACWGLALASLAPLAALGFRAWSGGGIPEAGRWVGGSLGTSLFSSAAGASAIVALGIPLGWALARGRRGAAWVDGAAILAFLTPGAVLGVGLIAVWNRPVAHGIYGTAWILVIGFAARYAAVGIRTCAALFAQSSPRVEEAAAALGASFLRRFARVTLPLHGRGLATAWLFAFVFCLRDLETTVLFYPPGSETLTVRIFTLEANGPEPVVAALALLHVAVTAAVLGIGALLLGRRTRT